MRIRVPSSQFQALSGVQMRLIGWAIALAAAALAPAAAGAQASSPAQKAPAAAAPAATAATPPAASAPVVYGSVGHMIPTPGVGEPDGRKGIQMQVTPIGREAANFHNNWLLPLCALISVFVLG